ncbi:hypothetical protein RSAG8_05546, partial [Rhizoctonia solani AG-8 WAC10335]
MRRGSGYIGTTQRRGGLDDNDTSDYSQDDEDQLPSTRHGPPGYRESYTTTTMYTRPSSRDKPSGIPRPGGQILRPPSAMKTPRGRPYNSTSSTDSSTTNENLPPVPQIPHTRARSGTPGTRNDSYNTPTDYQPNRPQSGLSRRASSISRPRSRTHSRSGYMDAEDPPPLPGSNSDSDSARVMEKSSKRASWAKDRRRFANATPNSITDGFEGESELLPVGNGDSRYDQPPTPVAAGRRSSLKPPSHSRNSITPTNTAPAIPSRIPSVPAKPARDVTKNRPSLERDTGSKHTSRANSSAGDNGTEDLKTPQALSRREPSKIRTSHASRTTDTLRSEPVKQITVRSSSASGATVRTPNRVSSVQPRIVSGEATGQREHVAISSRHDAQLPVSPFAQPGAATGNRTPRQDGTEGIKQPETISSP